MIKGTPEDNFFEKNPHLRYLTPVRNLIGQYDEVLANKYIWAVYLMLSPDSDLFYLDPEDRWYEIQNNYLKDGIEMVDLEEFMEHFPSIMLTPEQRRYSQLSAMLDKMISDAVKANDNKDRIAIMKAVGPIQSAMDSSKKKYFEAAEVDVTTRGQQQAGILANMGNRRRAGTGKAKHTIAEQDTNFDI